MGSPEVNWDQMRRDLADLRARIEALEQAIEPAPAPAIEPAPAPDPTPPLTAPPLTLTELVEAVTGKVITDWHRAAIAAEQATPDPTPPPGRGVSVEELADILEELRMAHVLAWRPGWRFHAARGLLDHPRLRPLLRGEGQAKRVELAQHQAAPSVPSCWTGVGEDGAWTAGWYAGWHAARAEVARQQGEEP